MDHSGTASIGHSAGYFGQVDVVGGSWTNSGLLAVSLYGTGTLNIEAGVDVSNSNGFIGRHADSIGTATGTGTGSTWTNTVDLYVGDLGTGSLTIENVGSVYVGDAAEDGAIPGWLTISDSTNTDGMGTGGHLYIKNGGMLTHHSAAVLGDQNGEFGYATVTGATSSWTNSSDLAVSYHGTAKPGAFMSIPGHPQILIPSFLLFDFRSSGYWVRFGH